MRQNVASRIAVLTLPAALAVGCAFPGGEPPATKVATAGGSGTLEFMRSYLPERMLLGSCAGPGCWIYVDVDRDCKPKPQFPITTLYNPSVVVVWEIRTPGYSWPTARDGIDIVTRPHSFVNGRRTAPTRWQWQARGRAGEGQKYYAYKVYVVEDKTGRECVLDPGLVTDW